MKCPVCKRNTLKPVVLEPNLTVQGCEKCGGHWLSSEAYWHWLEQQEEVSPEQPSEVVVAVNDNEQAKLCPTCGRILIKYKVGHGVNFCLDQCSACNGVWLDKHEWQALKTRSLHAEIHGMFSKSWQQRVLAAELRHNLERMYEQRFGAADYAELQRLRQWLAQHPQRAALLAYLSDDDPYRF